MSTDQASSADQLLASVDAEPGDRVRVHRDEDTLEGRVMPRHGFSDPDVVVLKLDSGYNIGLRVDEGDEVERLETGGEAPEQPPAMPDDVDELPTVALLGTGGTIASFVEYRTGAVHPATSPEELAAAVPEAFEHARLDPEVVFEAFSEDLTPDHWSQLADAVEAAFERGVEGVVVTHGTDTMHYTAMALELAFDELPGPVVLVGAQRSSDRPSSDAATNLTSAVRVAAETDAGEAMVVMHEGMSDETWAIHAAGRARKMHTSRRDAFQSLDHRPLGVVTDDAIEWNVEPREPADRVQRSGSFDADVGLVHSYPGIDADEIRAAARDGLVVAGTGLGHLPSHLAEDVDELTDEGTLVAMASQCLNGRTNMHVYETGRQLVEAGAIEAGDMLPETAYVKLVWALATADDPDEARELFRQPQGREQSPRTGFYYPREEAR
ncbi:Glu-tRNA(Gln) amidotransferase GatDE subunit D [Thermoplasmatales archaeon SW_10_69_26]|nr:MAG: Glu-tRNA(Gln) amidotransferase GatDE subunit D [Thermoplasmatales archaeon SW_10_69_26]